MASKILIIAFACYFFQLSQGKFSNFDIKLTRLIQDFGYLVETHNVLTQDGYILEIHRIPGIQGENIKTGKYPVLMMHGILSSSADWIVTGPNSSLALLLVDNGYDVWMGNNRGNVFGKNHTHFLENGYGFWDFSWHEFGIYDLPATIDYVLKETNTTDLNYICISQGCTQLFVMGSLKSEYNKKIRFAAALAPAAYFKFAKGLFAFWHNMVLSSKPLMENIGYFEFLPALSILRILVRHFCRFGNPWQKVCYLAFFWFGGIGTDEMDPETMADVLKYFPAGCSWKQIIHYHTIRENGEFSQYDYGSAKNLRLYNSTVPQKYPIENVQVPIAIFYGANDFLASPRDVLILASKLPKVIGKFIVPDRRLSHIDFLGGKNIRRLVYKPLLKILNTFRKS